MNQSSLGRAQLPPIDEVPAAHMLGRVLPNGWKVVERVERDPGSSGGSFSYQYFVENDRGERGFLKVLNIAAVLQPGSNGRMVDRMQYFSTAYVYERDLFRDCGGQRMSRLIRLIDAGDIDIPEAGILREVPYLIFEVADGDIRLYQAQLAAFDLAWVLRTLKHATLGVEQLHAVPAAHQDLRASNVLTQNGGADMKLTDLGRAERRDGAGPHGKSDIPGAVSYAPPEQLYGGFGHTWEERRAADMYQLGSLAVQLFLGHNLTSLVQSALPPEFRWRRWQGDFTSVKPYLRHAHAQVIAEFEDSVRARSGSDSLTADLVRAVHELTDPDPLLRGHPRDRSAKTSSYGVRRYVSLFNRLAAEASAGVKRRK